MRDRLLWRLVERLFARALRVERALGLQPRLDALAARLDAAGAPGRFADAAEELLA